MGKNIVVIGSGLAGTLISNELVKKGNVTMLEVGDKNSISYPQINFIQKAFAGVKTFCLGGGGTTNLWHNGLIPILAQDLTSTEFKEVLADAETYRDKAAANLFWLDNSYSTEYSKITSETNLLAERIGVFSDGVDCLLYPKTFSALSISTDVDDIYAVSDIEFTAIGKRITSVRYCVGEESFSVDADFVIISAGTLGSPLLVKKVLSAIECSALNIGTGLADHPMGFLGKVKVKKSISTLR